MIENFPIFFVCIPSIISSGHTYKKDGKVFYQLYSNWSIIFNCKIRFLDSKISDQVEIIKQTVKRASCYWLNYIQCETKAYIDEVSLGNNIYNVYGCPGFNLIVVLLISIKYEIEVCLENYNGKMNVNFGANSYCSTVNPSIEDLINKAKKDYDKKVECVYLFFLTINNTITIIFYTNIL